MKLLIAIPALNEEPNIRQIIERSLSARDHIISNSPVTEVAITVVSDGSTDRTVQVARQYAGRTKLIVFEQNKGYGAAIQEAWKQSDAELLGFLDADGTCDPRFFANLARALVDKRAHISLGCRLNNQSKMPLVRRVGNVFFAALLALLAGARVRDAASGMRVVRREAYERLRPLPNGLHFTPAMSARALLDRSAGMKVVEIDMPYHERVGESKLKLGRDGLRFLNVITRTAITYRCGRLAAIAAAAGAVIGTVVSISDRRDS